MNIIFIKSDSIKINLPDNQQEELCSKENIKIIAGYDTVLSFDIYDNDLLIGFAQLHKFEEGLYFLWNYAIDYNYQNKHYGTNALKELIKYMQTNYNLKEMTTTYIFGNDIAKHVYEKVGFNETSIVDEDDIHEVNMSYKIS